MSETKSCRYCSMEPNGDPKDDQRHLAIYDGGWTDSETGESITTQLLEVSLMRGDRLAVTFNGEYDLCKKINYCPMCGRKLEGARE